MNYKKIHDQIIERAQNENRKKLKRDHENYVYYERHHIIPKCMSGSNESLNFVLLTAREHFLIHWLLCRIYPDSKSLGKAFFMMSIYKNKDRSYKISSRIYKECKEIYSKSLLGNKMSNDTVSKIIQTINSKTNIEKQLINYKRSQTLLNKTDAEKNFIKTKRNKTLLLKTEDEKKLISLNISNSAKGKLLGTTKTQETKNKIAKKISKGVIQVFKYLTGEFVGEYQSANDLLKQLNIRHVQSFFDGTLKNEHIKGYVFKRINN